MSLRVTSEDFWGCELKSDSQEFTWQCTESDETEHKLFICQASLGLTAKEGERNVIEATCIDEEDGSAKSYIIVSLKLGLNETINLNIGFTSSVSLKLVSGSGPIHLVGSQLEGIYDDNIDDDSDDSEDDVELAMEQASQQNGRLEVDDHVHSLKDSHKISEINQANDSDDSSDEEEDEENDEDSSDSEVEAEEKIVQLPVTKQKKGVLKSKDRQAIKNEKKVSFSLDKKKSADPSKPQDLNEVKKTLGKIKTLPKTQEKFTNFMKANLKVTDIKVIVINYNSCKIINDAWLWVSKTRK
ncbi:hypothetical protein MXB_54 [Myxobolus squamalis]|nr:hypothetical protein MXB_54 [Myxobolus squamalis]